MIPDKVVKAIVSELKELKTWQLEIIDVAISSKDIPENVYSDVLLPVDGILREISHKMHKCEKALAILN